ncbi:MAG: diguanylate cyclase [Candidatus Velthaea sp.]|jgi:diguanylate cyclase (GGDEF)-like protein/PAS domain S-box-containing protein
MEHRVRAQNECESQRLLNQLVEQHALVPGLFRDHPQPMVLYDLEGRIVIGNKAAISLLGHPPGTLVGSHFSAHLAPGCVADAHAMRDIAVTGNTTEFDAVFVHADGHPVSVSTTIAPARLGEEIVGIYGIVREVRHEREVAAAVEQADRFRALYLLAASSGRTAQQRIEDTLTLGNELLAVDCGIVMRLDNGVLSPTHIVGSAPCESLRSLSIERAACRQLFSTFDPIAVDDIDRPPWDREPVRLLFPWRSFIATTFEIGGNFAGVIGFGSARERGELFSTADREFVRSISTVVSSTLERQAEQERLDALAFTDTLTGLPNRALLQDRLQQLIAESRRNGESFAVHFLDLDGFKQVNDTAGHADGDIVLRQTATRLKDALRESDSIARLGGDEFIVLQKHVRSAREAVALARTLLGLMRLPFVIEKRSHPLSASIGISIFPADGDTAKTLLGHADIALYRAKSFGRDRVALYTPRAPSVSAETRIGEIVRG